MFKRGILIVGSLLFLLAIGAQVVVAAEGAAVSDKKIDYFTVAAVVSSLGLSIAAVGGAFSQSRGIRSALEGIARNPGASGPMTTAMIIGLALIESLVIYVLVVSLIILFADPFALLS